MFGAVREQYHTEFNQPSFYLKLELRSLKPNCLT